MYTTSFAFFDAIADAGVTHCFVNLGSDHPSIMERRSDPKFPRIITCPSEVRGTLVTCWKRAWDSYSALLCLPMYQEAISV
jgi:hypothetical protein